MAYLSEIIVGGVTYGFEDTVAREMKPVTSTVTLAAASWTENNGVYTQTVTIEDGTASCVVALQPSIDQSVSLQNDGVTVLQVDNDNGTFIAKAVGAAPTADMTIQATIMEVRT